MKIVQFPAELLHWPCSCLTSLTVHLLRATLEYVKSHKEHSFMLMQGTNFNYSHGFAVTYLICAFISVSSSPQI